MVLMFLSFSSEFRSPEHIIWVVNIFDQYDFHSIQEFN